MNFKSVSQTCLRYLGIATPIKLHVMPPNMRGFRQPSTIANSHWQADNAAIDLGRLGQGDARE
jgi:hypothetical protein